MQGNTMLMLWAGKLQQLSKKDDGVAYEGVKELEKEKQQLSAAAIAKLAQQHEKLLQELRKTRKRLRLELEKTGGEGPGTKAAQYLHKTAEVRLADEEEEASLHDQGASPPRGRRRDKALHNNYFSPQAPSRRRRLPSSPSHPRRGSSASPTRAPRPSLPTAFDAPDSRRTSQNNGEKRASYTDPTQANGPVNAVPKARFDILPILTSNGESVFEVGLNAAQAQASSTRRVSAPAPHLLPVFRLPTVSSTSSVFVNRIPREESVEERVVRGAEEEEFGEMKRALGLSTQEIVDLERVLGLRDPNSDGPGSAGRFNRVRQFIREQMEQPPMPATQTTAAAFRGRRRRARKRQVPAGLNSDGGGDIHKSSATGGETPRCLREGPQATTEELREGLDQAIEVMRGYSSAIRDDVVSIKQLCPITHPRAKRFLRQWGAEKIVRIMEDLMFSAVVVSWERWKQRIAVQQKVERISAYLKFQATHKLTRFFEGWAKRHIAGAWGLWRVMILQQKAKERRTLELWSVRIIQRVFRGHRARKRVEGIKKQRRAIFEKAAATRIQSLARGAYVRRKLAQILEIKEQNHAVIKIQAIIRAKLARMKVWHMRRKVARLRIAYHMQRIFRGRRARRRVAAIRYERLRISSAMCIQRMARRGFARHALARIKRQLARQNAATVIQKHARASMARYRVKRLRRQRAEQRAREEKAALLIQTHYRGHKARTRFRLRMRVVRSEKERVSKAATKIQRITRGHLVRRQVMRMRKEKMDNMFDEARLWVEFWNEAENRWCYHNAVLNEVRSEPPRKGYTMADGRLVLENGLVVEDPLSKLTEEEKEERRAQKLCVECEAKDASRLCRQCNDKYCTSCFVKTHAGGKRAAHTYLQIGPIDCSECEGQVAVRWCTSCDDPFCFDCWTIIHLRGRRVRHAYCEIDGKGQVGARAIGPSGEDAGNFKAGQAGTGYSSDYGNDAYNSDYPGADGLQAEDPSSLNEWAQYADDNGTPYWYNTRTGISQYEDPRASDASQGQQALAYPYAAPDGYTSSEYTGADGLGVDASAAANPWAQYADDSGTPYWYNSVTGESTYTPPGGDQSAYGGGGEGLPAGWEMFYDDAGTLYYHNAQTGQTQYEQPY